MLSDISDMSSSVDDTTDDDEFHPQKKRKLKARKREDRPKRTTSMVNEQPSVYSSAEIRRHQKRLKRLKALEQGYGSKSDTDAESENENVDPDLDINLRIFESSAASTENLIEIQCDLKADDKATANHAQEKGNKNSSVFKVSVNTNFDEKSVQEEGENAETDDELEKEVDDLLSMDSCSDLTDDSDLEILISKPIVRRCAPVQSKKQKVTPRPRTDGKYTMYDFITEDCPVKGFTLREAEPLDGEEDADLETNQQKETPKEEIVEELKTDSCSAKKSLGVPQLKVNADGQVVVDMDSLVVEETGLSERRNAIANSELIEESALTRQSYRKKRSVPKQWSPKDTITFYQALSTIGTDFSLMATLFPGRTRTCMKRKYKREEKINGKLILNALSCKQTFDLPLLEQELRLKEERVNKLKENAKAKTAKKKTNDEPKKSSKKETVGKPKRRSYFETTIQCFQR